MHNIPTIHYSAGEVIIREGEPSNSVYMIISGKVEITKKAGSKDILLTTQGKNTIFGEMALLDGKRRSATVTAIEDTYCHRCDTLSLMRIISQLDIDIIHALKSLAHIIRSNNKIIIESQKDEDGIEKFENDEENTNALGIVVEDNYKPMTMDDILGDNIKGKIELVEPPFVKSLFRVLMQTAQQ